MMIRGVAFVLLMLMWAKPGAWAIEGMGNPWETIDDAICAAMKMQDFSSALGQPLTDLKSERVAGAGSAPGYCHLRATLDAGIILEVKLPVSGWTGQVLALNCVAMCEAPHQRRLDEALAQKTAIGLSVTTGSQPPDTAAFLREAVRLYYNRTP